MSAGSRQVGSEPGVQTLPAAAASLAAAPAALPAAPLPAGLLLSILDVTEQAAPAQRDKLAAFLAESSPRRALQLWLQWTGSAAAPAPDQLRRALGRAVAELDQLLSRQVNAILHHPRVQELEAAWRGLYYLVEQADGAEGVKIRVLNVSRRELARDLERAVEFDQSAIFKKVYESEFGTAGGEPYGLLIGDYQFSNHEADVQLLEQMSGLAAAAFAPFVAAASAAIFGLDRFSDLERPLNLRRTFEQLDYLKWRAFRAREDARFTGLTAPRVLMRLPYADDGSRKDGFVFREDVEKPDRSGYLWGNAAFAWGAVVVRAFAQAGWLANIRGVRRNEETGGVVTGLPVHCFSTDKYPVAAKSSTEVAITDQQEQDLSELGFIPLCHCSDTAFSAFYSGRSTQTPKTYDDPAATMNARVSSMLPYILCASRFAHYVKVITRDKIGTFAEAQECEDYLHRWFHRYVIADSEAGAEIKAEYPLREARVRVVPHPGKPGCYLCTLHLWPHFELDELTAAVRITTELAPSRTN
jgi:type VI secretion system ImpC/EvpB family protein